MHRFLVLGRVFSKNISIDDKDGGSIINVTNALAQKSNVKIEDWLKVVTQMSELFHALAKL